MNQAILTSRHRSKEAQPIDPDAMLEIARVSATIPPCEKWYIGIRPSDRPGDTQVYIAEGGLQRPLTHYPYHSRSGFEWGYAGSSPADLALALMADLFGEEPTREALDRGVHPFRSWLLHQDLKAEWVAGFPYRGWKLKASEIMAWVEGKVRELAEQEREY